MFYHCKLFLLIALKYLASYIFIPFVHKLPTKLSKCASIFLGLHANGKLATPYAKMTGDLKLTTESLLLNENSRIIYQNVREGVLFNLMEEICTKSHFFIEKSVFVFSLD